MRISRTKILAALAAVLTAGQGAGVFQLPSDTLQSILCLLGCGMTWTLRDAIGRKDDEG